MYLRGLCEFPVCWLDFGPYPSVCICTVAAAAFRYRRFPRCLFHPVREVQTGFSRASRPDKVTKKCICPVNVQSVNHVVQNRNHPTRIRLNVAFDSIRSCFFMVPLLLQP